MDTKTWVSQIVETKTSRNNRRRYSHYDCESLVGEWNSKRGLPGFTGDVFPVRAIAVLETFVRSWVSTMVGHSIDYAERAIPLVQSVKPDYRLVLSITGQVISFADIIAHTVSVTNLTHIMSVFGTLCSKEVPPLLQSAVDRWSVEIEGNVPIPIIDDYERVMSDVGKLFEVRHLICHEALGPEQVNLTDIGDHLRSLVKLTHAFEEVLTEELYGRVPLTQSEMNEHAFAKYQEADGELKQVLRDLRELYETSPRKLKLLNTAQSAWERYRKLQSTFRHDPIGGGSIGPVLRSSEATDLTLERTERLKAFLKTGEGLI